MKEWKGGSYIASVEYVWIIISRLAIPVIAARTTTVGLHRISIACLEFGLEFGLGGRALPQGYIEHL